MKKILIPLIIAIIFILTFIAAFPIYADQPDNPGLFGREGAAYQAQLYPGGHRDAVQSTKENLGDFGDAKNLGQAQKWILNTYCGIPPKHSP